MRSIKQNLLQKILPNTFRKLSSSIRAVAIIALFLCLAGTSQATFVANKKVYKTVHEDGTITYSDQESVNAVEVELRVPTSTFQSQHTPSPPHMQSKPKQRVAYIVSILSPEKEATIRNNAGELSIGAAIEPKVGGFFQLHINGQIHESATGMFRLTNMERGAYQYTVKFIDNSGKLIASSESRNVYLHQASALIN
jgi:hypothetical protein